jgi:hypothetical protein
MDLFIANVTEQNRTFHWRELENPRIFNLDIPAGTQAQILRDKSPEIVNDVIEHHKIYGIVDEAGAKNATRNGQKVTLVYSTKGSLPQEIYALAQEVNDDIAAQEVQVQKEKAAYAFAKTIEQDQTGMSEGVKEVELEIIEDKPKDPARSGKSRIDQKFSAKINK